MAEPRKCARCGKIRIIRGRELCASCHSYERQCGDLSKYPKNNLGHRKRYGYCEDCGEYTRVSGKNKCKKCYQRWHMSQPGNKEKHAKKEKDRRKKLGERYRILDKKRSKTENRQKWQKKYSKQYYQDNREKLLEYQVNWRQENKEQFKGYMRTAYLRRKEADGITTSEQWQAIIDFYCPDNKCLACGKTFNSEVIEDKLTQDHVIPVSKGGSNWPENMQPICYSCNCSKSDVHETDYRPDNGQFAKELMI